MERLSQHSDVLDIASATYQRHQPVFQFRFFCAAFAIIARKYSRSRYRTSARHFAHLSSRM